LIVPSSERVVSDFRELKVWQRGHEVTLAVYQLTASFPASEAENLVAQMRRAAVSVTANIAESRGRHGVADQVRLLHFALGSARELESHVLTGRDLGFARRDTAESLLGQINEVERMLSGLIRYSRTPKTPTDR
jgi:four helix bundle protein